MTSRIVWLCEFAVRTITSLLWFKHTEPTPIFIWHDCVTWPTTTMSLPPFDPLFTPTNTFVIINCKNTMKAKQINLTTAHKKKLHWIFVLSEQQSEVATGETCSQRFCKFFIMQWFISLFYFKCSCYQPAPDDRTSCAQDSFVGLL